MYNRYIQRDEGPYRPVPPEPPRREPPPPPGELHVLEGLLDRLHLRDLDSGDLLLLLILFLLFRQEADEEALIALALLLIL